MTKDSKLVHESRLQQQEQADKQRAKYVSLIESNKLFDKTNS